MEYVAKGTLYVAPGQGKWFVYNEVCQVAGPYDTMEEAVTVCDEMIEQQQGVDNGSN